MMKKFRRIICIALVLISLIQLMAGCAVKKTDEEYYLTRGEFFAYFVHENNLTSTKYSDEEIQTCEDGSVEADVLVEWGYLTEKQAAVSLRKDVDKETVVTVCANATFDLKEGNISDIKDAKLLDDPQLIADAHASGFFELENGYFDGAKKMTFAECEEIWEKAKEFMAGTHYNPEDNSLEMTDDVHVDDGSNYTDGDIQIEFHKTSLPDVNSVSDKPLSAEATGDNTSYSLLRTSTESASVSKALRGTTLNNEDAQTRNLNALLGNVGNVSGFTANIQKNRFDRELRAPKVGETVVFSGFNTADRFHNDKIVGVLKSAELSGNYYRCEFDYPSFEMAAEKISDDNKKTNASGVDKINFKKELDEYMGWKLEFDVSGDAINIKAKKGFTSYESGRKQEWQNSKKTINAEVDFSISDFQIDTNNIKSFATKRSNGFIRITWDTDMSFSLDTSLRYTPDSNRNGKFPSNWSNSRWTDSDSKGAKEIKIARFNPNLYGIVGAEVYIYLLIQVDGKISFRTSVEDGGMQIVHSNGAITAYSLGKKTIEASAQINLHSRLGVDASIKLFTFINVIEYDIGVDFDAKAMANIYYENQKAMQGVYADEERLNAYVAEDSKFGYCVGLEYALSGSGYLKDSGVKIILDWISKGKALDFTYKFCSGGIHFEDGKTVPKCTRGQGEDELKTSDNDDIELEAYKVNLNKGQCTMVSLEAIPSASKTWLKSKNTITVKSKDDKIAKATYSSNSKSIIVEAVGEGSTEIVITAKTGILFWKKTIEQQVSVTVNAMTSPISAESCNEALSQIQIVYL